MSLCQSPSMKIPRGYGPHQDNGRRKVNLVAGIRTDPIGFHLWVTLPAPWTRSAFVGHMRSTGIGVVASDAFATDGSPPEAVRVCLGGPPDRAAVRSALEFTVHALAELPTLASTFL